MAEAARARRRAGPLALVLGGLVLGLAGVSPNLWWAAWLGTAAIAYGLCVCHSVRDGLAGWTASILLTRALWFAWSLPMARGLLPGQPGLQLFVGIGFVVVVTIPTWLLTAAGLVLFRDRRWTLVWLPVAWVLADRLLVAWTSIASDWPFTQVEAPVVLAAVGHLGLVATSFLCLFVASSAGQALALRSRGTAVASLGVLVAGAGAVSAMGPLPPRTEALERVGVVHLRALTEVPPVDALDDRVDLLVWPEASFAAQPVVREDGGEGATIAPAPGGPTTSHLLGVLTPPRYGRQNMALAVEPDGRIAEGRAKRVLMPYFERAFLGLGADLYVPGTSAPLLQAGGLRVAPLICGEVLSRGLFFEARDAGAELLAILASDRYQSRLPQPRWQVLAHLRLRAAEVGLPAVYSSLEGQAAIVAADGRVLAESPDDAPSGVITWSEAEGAEQHQPQLDPPVAVLYSRDTPWLRTSCKPGRCAYHAIEELRCDEVTPARTVVVAGHGDLERALGKTPDEVARAVACFAPDLVVMETCFGASTTHLAALGRATDALVVASAAAVDGQGFRYRERFYDDVSPVVRARAVATDPPTLLYTGRPDPHELAAVEAIVPLEDPDVLRPRVRSWAPTLVTAELDDGQEVLAPADWKHIGHPPERGLLGSEGSRAWASALGRRHVVVHSLWVDGPDVRHREELDAFLECLIDGSTFNDFWEGALTMERGGSHVVPMPEGPIGRDDTERWLDDAIDAIGLPQPPEGTTPIYLVYTPAPPLDTAVCGTCAPIEVRGRRGGIAIVRTGAPCWPSQGPVRSLTQYTAHELSCASELILGLPHVAADVGCDARDACPDVCANLTGLHCPGAPEVSYTGCDGNPVRGWVVQRLGHPTDASWTRPPCAPCDFAIRRRSPGPPP